MAKKEKTKEIIVKEQRSEVSNFITQAIEKGLPVETMEKLFALQREWKADKERSSDGGIYSKAISARADNRIYSIGSHLPSGAVNWGSIADPASN